MVRRRESMEPVLLATEITLGREVDAALTEGRPGVALAGRHHGVDGVVLGVAQL